ncbi:MAG: GTPase Era [Gammaproteobacteria bacterium]|jgi:GTP-binding protein Era
MDKSRFRCGYAAIVGRTNVGKSTLLNRLLRQKISVTSRKPQTTRQRLLGIKTTSSYQVIYVDTPGLHQHDNRALNRYMNRVASNALLGVDVVIWLVEAMRWTDMDAQILERLSVRPTTVLVGVNKIDRVIPRKKLLPFLDVISKYSIAREIIPLAARRGENAQRLEEVVVRYLPEQDAIFPEDQITDRSDQFLAAEFIREKLIRRLGQELPYRLNVQIEQSIEQGQLLHVDAIVWVEKTSQKAIVIGERGQVLKDAGSAARKDLERLFDRQVFLRLWVKVKEDWSDDEQALPRMGYGETW